jgi:carboxypeptidase Taq
MPASPSRQTYDRLVERLRRVAYLSSCGNLLGWDEQTNMPPGGAEHRSQQASLVAGLAHEWATAPEIGTLLTELEGSELVKDATSPEAVNIREARRDFDRATKLPQRLVEEQSRVATLAQQAWIEARKKSDFTHFLPWLEKTVALKREEAACLAKPSGVPYDALLDQFEPGMTSAEVTRLFTPLRDALVTLIGEVRDANRPPRRDILNRRFPVDAQKTFAVEAAKKIGFDFNRGRLDVAAHPFCSGIGPGDTRLTTRYDERHFPGAFFGTLHEAGHGIYDQGLDAEAFGLGMGSPVSLGIHESQSRLWENFVGRGLPFWKHFYPQAQQAFPEALADVPLADFHGAINDVQPSFIRVEADEATYNLHILLRFEIEKPLVSGDLSPKDVPGAWNELFTKSFGMTPPDDARGCLQDIHWSFGGIGYFPTYTLGNMHAAQLFEAAERELGGLAPRFERGEFGPLKNWLNEQIHHRGKLYPAGELAQVVTGTPLSHEALIRHLRARFAPTR